MGTLSFPVSTHQSVHDVPTSFEMISLLTQSLSWKSQNQISFLLICLPQEEKLFIKSMSARAAES